MFIKSNRVWIAGDFIPAVIEISEGKIKGIYPAENHTADVDYGNVVSYQDLLISTVMVRMVMIQTTPNLKDLRNGQKEFQVKVLQVFFPQQSQN